MSGRKPIFVYGTLRPGQPGFAELALVERVDVIGSATVAGTLYDLGDYPGAVLPRCPLHAPGLIAGELLTPRDDGVLGMLDEFELYDPADPAGSEYLRVVAPVADGSSVWIYVYNFPLEGVAVIASGNWGDRCPPIPFGPSRG